MPTLINKRGKKRYVATPYYKGKRGKTKLMPDASKKSYRTAVTYEQEQIEQLKAEMDQTAMDCLTVLKWSDEYLDYVKMHYVKRTYQEKYSAFKRFVSMGIVTASTPVQEINRFIAAKFLNGQVGDRSGNAINKDRKNMATAWRWGTDTMEGFPRAENPFLAVPKKKTEKQPRYVPPMEDFWKVYAHVEQLSKYGDDRNVQDQVMLLAYLHLAARRSELFKAKWSDVDWNTIGCHSPLSCTMIFSCGQKNAWHKAQWIKSIYLCVCLPCPVVTIIMD